MFSTLDGGEHFRRADGLRHAVDLQHRFLRVDGTGDVEASDDVGVGLDLARACQLVRIRRAKRGT